MILSHFITSLNSELSYSSFSNTVEHFLNVYDRQKIHTYGMFFVLVQWDHVVTLTVYNAFIIPH